MRWTYGAQPAHKVDDRMRLVGQPMGYAWRDSVAAEANALGAVIHGGGGACRLHPDAELVHDCVIRLKTLEHGRVMDFDITGVLPLGDGTKTPRFQPKLQDNGKSKMMRDHNDNVIACVVEELVSPMNILFWRQPHLTWWEAMIDLAVMLRAEGLRSCGEPASTLEPWSLTGLNAAPHRVLDFAGNH